MLIAQECTRVNRPQSVVLRRLMFRGTTQSLMTADNERA